MCLCEPSFDNLNIDLRRFRHFFTVVIYFTIDLSYYMIWHNIFEKNFIEKHNPTYEM